jgi:hypothetical protein
VYRNANDQPPVLCVVFIAAHGLDTWSRRYRT